MIKASRPAVAYLRPPDPPELDLGLVPRDLNVVAVVTEAAAGQPTRLGEALEWIASGEARALFVYRLSALAGSLSELAGMLEWLQAAGTDLVAVDLELDTGSASGRHAVALVREIDGWAREPDRPRGRPGLLAAAPGLVERIAALRQEGLSLHSIAARLEAEGVPTPRGGLRWRASSVQSALGYRRPRPPASGAPPPPPRAGGPPPGPPAPRPRRRAAGPPPPPEEKSSRRADEQPGPRP